MASGKFVGYDAANGKKLWDFFAQTGIVAAPVTYEIDGEQYVTVLAGWGGALPLFAGEVVTEAPRGGVNRVLTFKLGARASCRRCRRRASRSIRPRRRASPETVAEAARLYELYCTQCHGHSVVAGGVVPDLRYSATLAVERCLRRRSCSTAP